ncbi:hypothetical protein L917_11086 [Phytophthora nicotianae]|uniref:Uncharacterized protein n=1 Tax=Phytophthora nicotianae TaxID=4792 RepID=W2KY71_PHYNI|nr:hypothetical protein L917_11086 [Phytophthora nicotianae]
MPTAPACPCRWYAILTSSSIGPPERFGRRLAVVVEVILLALGTVGPGMLVEILLGIVVMLFTLGTAGPGKVVATLRAIVAEQKRTVESSTLGLQCRGFEHKQFKYLRTLRWRLGQQEVLVVLVM